MMDCNETVAKLQTYLDRELSEIEIGQVQIHLEACPPCLGHFKFEAHLKRLIQLRCVGDAAPDTLRTRIGRAIKNF